MTAERVVVVLGASGFVGSAVVDALRLRGATVVSAKAPRAEPVPAAELPAALKRQTEAVAALGTTFAGVDAVVNAAGIPDASSRDEPSLMAANALMPAMAATAAAAAAVPRFVQVSSAVVQGRAAMLDQSDLVSPFSAYSRSKAIGEALVREIGGRSAVVYRPPSVHAADRRVSRMIARIARSPIASVARPGSSPTPQALLPNVADAIAFLALCDERPPAVVAHPSEGLTTAGLLLLLGGRAPREIPHHIATAVVTLLAAAGRVLPRLAADARRVEMLWLGQAQATSWLTEVGWTPPVGHDGWAALGQQLADAAIDSTAHATQKDKT